MNFDFYFYFIFELIPKTEQEFEAVVGDLSLIANRSDQVDFTYKYMQAGVSMIVRVQDDDSTSKSLGGSWNHFWSGWTIVVGVRPAKLHPNFGIISH